MQRSTVGLILCSTLLATGWVWAGSAAAAGAPPTPVERARAVLKAQPIIDGHNDLPWALRTRFAGKTVGVDLRDEAAARAAGLDTDFARLRRGGVGGQFWSLWVPGELKGPAATVAVVKQMDLVRRLAARYPDETALAFSADEVVKAQASGRVASLMGIEGGEGIDDSLEVLRSLYRLGARYMTLTHFGNTDWADSSNGDPVHGGLTPFGKAVVREMNRLGMLVDLSHVSAKTMSDALDVAEAPVIFSHSSTRALADHPRNVPDAILKRVAGNGGVVMVNFVPFYVNETVRHWFADVQAEEARQRALHPGDPAAVKSAVEAWRAAHPRPPVSLKDVADHIEHVRAVAGVDHVGIGADFGDTDGLAVDGVSGVDADADLIAELARRGWSDADLKKLTGQNILRVLRAVEQAATRIQASRAAAEDLISELDKKP
jgi:membrane dipeptidase